VVMSLLSRISGIFGAPRNEAAVAATPAVTTVPARGGAIPSPSLGGYSARAPETQLDDFTKKYASAPYHSTRARAGHVYFEPRPFVSKLMIAAVAKRAGELFSAEEVKAVADIASKMQRADQQLQENAFSRVSALVRAAMPDIEVAIREGRQPGNFASFEEKQKQTVVIRRAIH
jgi:hypothetical protein